jgi:hypothetical protein
MKTGFAERFGGQTELELVVPTPSVIPAAEAEESELLKAARALAWKDDKKEAAN